MLSGLVKAQLVAFLTKKLLDSPAFTKSVETLHGEVSFIQKQAYTALLKATQEGDARLPPMERPPKESEPIKVQNQQLLNFIEKTKRDMKERESP